MLADVAPLLAGREGNADPRYQQLKRGSLHTETTAKVKSLSGFRKFHHVPEHVSASSARGSSSPRSPPRT